GRAIVSTITPDSPAKQAGIHTGWELVRIGRAEVEPMIARMAQTHSRFTELMTVRALASRLDGPVNSEVNLEFSDIDSRRIAKSLVRRVASGELTRFGFLPPRIVSFDSKKLAGNLEYIHFNIFLKPDIVVTRFGEAIRECGQCPGVIVDLRGNPGGLGAM